MKAAFLGSKQLGLRIFRGLHEADPSIDWFVVHPDDRGDPRNVMDSFHAQCLKIDVPFHIFSASHTTLDNVLSEAPDIVIACGWYSLLSPNFLQSIPMGCFGVHNSLLPKYRGWAPLVWSIINGEPKVGSSVIRFGDGMDDGDILHQVCVPLAIDNTIADALNALEAALIESLPDIWVALIRGKTVLTPQDHQEASYCGRRIPADGNISWSMPAYKVHNFIRALVPPYPGAFSYLDGRHIIFEKTLPSNVDYYGTPGQVLQVEHDRALIACGEGTALWVMSLLFDGESVAAHKILNSTLLRLDHKPPYSTKNAEKIDTVSSDY